MSEKNIDEASVCYILRLKENRMVFNDQFSGLIIDTGQTFRVHKLPFITVEKRELSQQIVVATLAGSFDDQQIEAIEKALTEKKMVKYGTGAYKDGKEICKEVDRRWYPLPPEQTSEIESVYFPKEMEELLLEGV